MWYYVVNDESNKPYKITVTEIRNNSIEGIPLPSLPVDLDKLVENGTFEKVDNIYIRKGVN